MPYPVRISLEYTNNTGARQKTFEVDGSHLFQNKNAKFPEHAEVEVACSGPISPDPTVMSILFRLKP